MVSAALWAGDTWALASPRQLLWGLAGWLALRQPGKVDALPDAQPTPDDLIQRQRDENQG